MSNAWTRKYGTMLVMIDTMIDISKVSIKKRSVENQTKAHDCLENLLHVLLQRLNLLSILQDRDQFDNPVLVLKITLNHVDA